MTSSELRKIETELVGRGYKAMDWLADNVSERDALNWEYEIIDFNKEEDNE